MNAFRLWRSFYFNKLPGVMIINGQDENYMFPKKAENKLRTAKRTKTPVYLYGVTGVGKTSLVRQFLMHRKYLYHKAADLVCEENMIHIPKDEKVHIVVIDDLHEIVNQEERRCLAELTGTLQGQGNVWLILISRAPVPGWLMEVYIRYSFMVIAEEDFYFLREEQDAWLGEKKITMLNKDKAWECTQGIPIAVRLLILHGGDIEKTREDLLNYLESHVYDQWDLELEEFFMATSIVENFTKELAEMITGSSHVDILLARAMELGNFFAVCGRDGIWQYRWQMALSMRRRLQKKCCKEKIQQYYHHAGLYYEMHGQILEALSMYEMYGDTESISRILVSNVRKNPATGHYYELKNYYLKLPEEVILENPLLIAGMSMLQSMLMNEEESERWYHELEEYARTHSGSERREAKSRLLYLDIGLPHRGSVNLAEILKHAGILLRERGNCLPEFSVTSNLPSMMNGGKDFCEWSRHDRELAVSIGKPVEFVLGKYGKGLVPLALAESFLEKGMDSYEIMSLAQKGKLAAESGGKAEQGFVAAGILSWLSILDGNAEYARKQLEAFRGLAEREAPNLLKNLDAFRCRVSLYQNDYEYIEAWMKEAPDELAEFSTMERYRYLTKVRVYLQQGKYECACALSEQLLYYAEKMHRTYIRMEARLLLSAALYCLHREKWQEVMQQCISEAESYHFVRILSREGTVAERMLRDGKFIFRDAMFESQVKAECKQMSEYYPKYLDQGSFGEIQLSENALNILRLQAEGLSARMIAEKLSFTVANVKYHISETYRKLGVKSQTAAINEARKRNIL